MAAAGGWLNNQPLANLACTMLTPILLLFTCHRPARCQPASVAAARSMLEELSPSEYWAVPSSPLLTWPGECCLHWECLYSSLSSLEHSAIQSKCSLVADCASPTVVHSVSIAFLQQLSFLSNKYAFDKYCSPSISIAVVPYILVLLNKYCLFQSILLYIYILLYLINKKLLCLINIASVHYLFSIYTYCFW